MTQPLPLLDETNRFFWTSGSDGLLRFLRCQTCSGWLHPPGPRCRICGSRDLEPEPVSGNARVVGWTINHQPWHPDFPPPYVVAIVVIAEDEHVRLTTNLVNIDPEEVSLGLAVCVTFKQVDDVWLPLFEPVEESSS